MVEITPRPIAKPAKPGKREGMRRGQQCEELPKFGSFLKGQTTHISSRSPLRCYYYNKQVRGRWSSAERSITGMRWNAYMVSGKALPKLEPLAPQKMQVVKGIMKEIETGKEKIGSSREAGGRALENKPAAAAFAAKRAKENSRIWRDESSTPHSRAVAGFERPEIRAPRLLRQGHIRIARNAEAQVRSCEMAAPETAGKEGTLPQAAKERLHIVRTARPHAKVLEIRPGAMADFRTHEAGISGQTHEPLAHDSGMAVAVSAKNAPQDIGPAHHQGGHEIPDLQKIALIVLRLQEAVPANDHFFPREPWPSAAVSHAGFQPPADSHAREVGYISSRQRRAFQLKSAQGAAALPQ